MIKLTRLNHSQIVVNSDLIQFIEATPDTVVTLTTNEKIVVLESPDEIIEKVIEFRRRIHNKLEVIWPQRDNSNLEIISR